MTFEKVKRGDLYGPIFEVEHLATFSVGSKQGKLGKIHVFLIISFQKVNFIYMFRTFKSRRWHA